MMAMTKNTKRKRRMFIAMRPELASGSTTFKDSIGKSDPRYGIIAAAMSNEPQARQIMGSNATSCF